MAVKMGSFSSFPQGKNLLSRKIEDIYLEGATMAKKEGCMLLLPRPNLCGCPFFYFSCFSPPRPTLSQTFFSRGCLSLFFFFPRGKGGEGEREILARPQISDFFFPFLFGEKENKLVRKRRREREEGVEKERKKEKGSED